MSRGFDCRVTDVEVYLLPVETRMPLKFGTAITTHVSVLRVRLTVEGSTGRAAVGWGETPLSVQWAWPSATPFSEREQALEALSLRIAETWAGHAESGHPLEVGHGFLECALPALVDATNLARNARGLEPVPWLAALICSSAFDLALHDAYGVLHGRPTYETYSAEYMNRDLASYLEPLDGAAGNPFRGKHPRDYFVTDVPTTLTAWHLVGGVDPLTEADLTGAEPDDGYPVLLGDWIERDGLNALKIKLRGNDLEWDYQRVVDVGRIATSRGVDWLSTDFNCTVREVGYVTEILDRLLVDEPRIYGMVLYVEQPFDYHLDLAPKNVLPISARKPLFMDESAHDWKLVRQGREAGWTGVALKTCKTQTGALLAMCWAKEHGMTLMVQDLTNPMLAQVPHVLLAAHAGTIMGVETNAMQFYPDASVYEARIHPGLYARRDGVVDLSTLRGAGFGYRVEEIGRPLPAATRWEESAT